MKSFFRIIIICLLIASSTDFAQANDGGSTSTTAAPGKDSGPAKVICNVVKVLSGSISQGIATLVIIITGYSFFVGKISIGMLFVVAAGIMFVFGAQTIVGWATGSKIACEGGDVMD